MLAGRHLSLTLCQPEWTSKKLARSGGAVMPQRQVLLPPSRVFQLTPGPLVSAFLPSCYRLL